MERSPRHHQRPASVVNVVDEDPDLVRQLSPERRDKARQDGVARLVVVPTDDPFPVERTRVERGGLGMLVLEGVAVRGFSVGGRDGLELFGRGDLVRPHDPSGSAAANVVMPADARWWSLITTRLAVLDARFTRKMCGYPEVMDELGARLERRSSTHAMRLTIMQQPRLTLRLHHLLWHLADRFGLSHDGGVLLPLPLSHELLAKLVGAQRPSVSRALKELERSGELERRPDGSWWLTRKPRETGEEPGPAADNPSV